MRVVPAFRLVAFHLVSITDQQKHWATFFFVLFKILKRKDSKRKQKLAPKIS